MKGKISDINDLVTQGQGIQKMTLELDIPSDIINQISGELGNALSSGDNERSLMEARNLVNRLEYLINVELYGKQLFGDL